MKPDHVGVTLEMTKKELLAWLQDQMAGGWRADVKLTQRNDGSYHISVDLYYGGSA